MSALPASREGFLRILLAILAAAGLLGLSRYNYLLFHTTAELFSVTVAYAIFVLAWNTRRMLDNGYLLFLGIAYVFVALLDMLHMLAFKGMGVWPESGANLPTQLWIAARGLQATSLLIAPLFLRWRARPGLLLGAYGAGVALLLLTILTWKSFPTCYVDNQGLTAFKIVSEYVICGILLGALVILRAYRAHFSPVVLRLVGGSLVVTILSELAFTRYVSVYADANMIGHLLKIAAFYLLYKAFVETGLRRPYELLFRDLQESEARYRSLVQMSPDAIFINRDNRIEFVNPAAIQLFGATGPQQLLGRSPFDVFHRDYHTVMRARIETLLNGCPVPLVEGQIVRMDGTVRIVEFAAGAFDARSSRAIQVILRDVSARKRLEEQIAQAKKLESVGQLAGGVAHEFNNMLTVILGYVEMAKAELADGDPVQESLDRIQKASTRAVELTRQLLSYARKQMIQPREVLLNDMLTHAGEMLHRLLGEPIRLELHLQPDLWLVEADPGQIEQILVNLALNARDAMPEGGRVVIHTGNVVQGHDGLSMEVDLPPGEYVMLSVSDTGHGMADAVCRRIFEPFFTTKSVGQGTGLGLSTCYGIVKQHHGDIHVESQPGRGTTFTVYLPRARDETQEAPTGGAAPATATSRDGL